VLVQGVASDKAALGFFGYAYYKENTERLKVVPIDDGDGKNGAGPIAPSLETVGQGTYQPLSRPIFIYVSRKEADRPEIAKFVEFYLGDKGQALVAEVGYIPLRKSGYDLANKRFADRVTGSVFAGGSQVGVTVEELLVGKK
jgi:phosphate transport system substrate-binding protein